jgi:hypothetical protein
VTFTSNCNSIRKTEVKNLLALVDDAFAFVRYFAMPVARIAPHIYVVLGPRAVASLASIADDYQGA